MEASQGAQEVRAPRFHTDPRRLGIVSGYEGVQSP